jgi:hypothetical protein
MNDQEISRISAIDMKRIINEIRTSFIFVITAIISMICLKFLL